MYKYLDILGHRVVDKVTGFKGVAASVTFDLYGCIQVIVNPGLDNEGKPKDCHWFDYNRLTITGEKVMDPPDYVRSMSEEGMADAKHGPAERPAFADRRPGL